VTGYGTGGLGLVYCLPKMGQKANDYLNCLLKFEGRSSFPTKEGKEGPIVLLVLLILVGAKGASLLVTVHSPVRYVVNIVVYLEPIEIESPSLAETPEVRADSYLVPGTFLPGSDPSLFVLPSVEYGESANYLRYGSAVTITYIDIYR